jgi:predicted DNA-binding protein
MRTDNIEYGLRTCEADKTFSLRLPSWLKDKLDAVARSKGTTMSAIALGLIKHGIMERVNGDL